MIDEIQNEIKYSQKNACSFNIQIQFHKKQGYWKHIMFDDTKMRNNSSDYQYMYY